MKRTRSEQQQGPLAKRQKREAARPRRLQTAKSEARTAAAVAATLSMRGASALSSGLREQSQSRRGSGDKQRHKRRSFGSDGSGSSAFGGSEGTATSTSSPSPAATARSDDSLELQREWYARIFGEPDVVLHVGDCSFGVHLRVLRQHCRSLFDKMAALRGQWTPDSEHGDSSRSLSVVDGESDDTSAALPFALPPFVLQLVDGERFVSDARLSAEIALSSARVRCSLETTRALPTFVKRRKSEPETPFAAVHCVAHTSARASVASRSDSSTSQRSESLASPRGVAVAAEPDAAPPRVERPLPSSAGKENLASNRQSSSPEAPSLAQPTMRHRSPTRQEAKQEDTSEALRETARSHTAESLEHVAQLDNRHRHMMHVEWSAAEPAAVASVLEFLYTGETRLVDVSSAEHVVQLCRWLGLDNELLSTCLSIAIERATYAQWMPLLLVAARVRDQERRKALLDQLLAYLRNVPSERAAEVLANVQLNHLGVLRDVAVVTKVVTRLVNCVRHVGVWRNALVGLALWTRRTFGRPLSLRELHWQYAPWEPFIALPGVQIGGEAHYVRPKTLFRFGAFALQVRFEVDSLVLIQWRVVKDGGDGDDSDPHARVDFDARRDPPFALRGEMKVLFRCARDGPTQEQAVTLRYMHAASDYGVWKPLVRSSSESARLISAIEIRAARSEEGLPSQTDSIVAGTASQPEPEAVADAVEFMRARFTGRFFVWGHALCNLVHYLSVCTLFYSSPSGDAGDLVRLNVLEKMQRVPVDTLVLVLQSDRLRVPGGETMLLQILTTLCFGVDYARGGGVSPSSTDFSDVRVVRALFGCVRWCFADLSHILRTLERVPREYMLYELIQRGLRDPLLKFPRRVPYGQSETPYHVVTSLVEFEIEAGDRALSPDGVFSQESVDDGGQRDDDGDDDDGV